MRKSRTKFAVALTALALTAALVAGCGGSDDEGEATSTAGTAQLAPVKEYLTDHSAELVEEVERLRAAAGEYYRLADRQLGADRLP